MKKFISIFIIMVTVFFSIGCAKTKHEVNELAAVVAVGADLTPDNKYMLTFQILDPQNSSSQGMMSQSSGGQNVGRNTITYSITGDTPETALNHLSTKLGKHVFLGTLEYTVLGKRLVESGFSLYIDAILRSYRPRPDTPLFVTKGEASDIIATSTSDENIPANTVKNLINAQMIYGYSPIVRKIDFVNAVASKTAAPVLGIIDFDKENPIGGPLKLEGTAVFKKDKLIGNLDMNATRGMNWIKGDVKGGSITSTLSNNDKVTFTIIHANSKIKAIEKNDTVVIQINIKEVANIRELTADMDPIENPKIMGELSKIQDKAIEQEIKLALDAAQKDLKADIFDFGGVIHKTHPDAWKRLEKDWEDIFPNIKVEINVNSQVKRPGPISKPIK